MPSVPLVSVSSHSVSSSTSPGVLASPTRASTPRAPRAVSSHLARACAGGTATPVTASGCGLAASPQWQPPADWSFYRRDLPADLIPFNSPQGRRLFTEALADGTMECYFPLAEQFTTQAEPAYCAITTLTMCLNALGVDPGRNWKLPWRWFSEEMLECCTPMSVIRDEGMTFRQFSSLSRCHGVLAQDFRADLTSIDHFRALLHQVASNPAVINPAFASAPHGNPARGGLKAALVVSFSRKALGQTGDGHMSPLAGYHAASDSVLVLDVARFKYPSFWVSVPRLWAAMLPHDKLTERPRGYCLLSPLPPTSALAKSSNAGSNSNIAGAGANGQQSQSQSQPQAQSQSQSQSQSPAQARSGGKCDKERCGCYNSQSQPSEINNINKNIINTDSNGSGTETSTGNTVVSDAGVGNTNAAVLPTVTSHLPTVTATVPTVAALPTVAVSAPESVNSTAQVTVSSELSTGHHSDCVSITRQAPADTPSAPAVVAAAAYETDSSAHSQIQSQSQSDVALAAVSHSHPITHSHPVVTAAHSHSAAHGHSPVAAAADADPYASLSLSAHVLSKLRSKARAALPAAFAAFYSRHRGSIGAFFDRGQDKYRHHYTSHNNNNNSNNNNNGCTRTKNASSHYNNPTGANVSPDCTYHATGMCNATPLLPPTYASLRSDSATSSSGAGYSDATFAASAASAAAAVVARRRSAAAAAAGALCCPISRAKAAAAATAKLAFTAASAVRRRPRNNTTTAAAAGAASGAAGAAAVQATQAAKAVVSGTGYNTSHGNGACAHAHAYAHGHSDSANGSAHESASVTDAFVLRNSDVVVSQNSGVATAESNSACGYINTEHQSATTAPAAVFDSSRAGAASVVAAASATARADPVDTDAVAAATERLLSSHAVTVTHATHGNAASVSAPDNGTAAAAAGASMNAPHSLSAPGNMGSYPATCPPKIRTWVLYAKGKAVAAMAKGEDAVATAIPAMVAANVNNSVHASNNHGHSHNVAPGHSVHVLNHHAHGHSAHGHFAGHSHSSPAHQSQSQIQSQSQHGHPAAGSPTVGATAVTAAAKALAETVSATVSATVRNNTAAMTHARKSMDDTVSSVMGKVLPASKEVLTRVSALRRDYPALNTYINNINNSLDNNSNNNANAGANFVSQQQLQQQQSRNNNASSSANVNAHATAPTSYVHGRFGDKRLRDMLADALGTVSGAVNSTTAAVRGNVSSGGGSGVGSGLFARLAYVAAVAAPVTLASASAAAAPIAVVAAPAPAAAAAAAVPGLGAVAGAVAAGAAASSAIDAATAAAAKGFSGGGNVASSLTSATVDSASAVLSSNNAAVTADAGRTAVDAASAAAPVNASSHASAAVGAANEAEAGDREWVGGEWRTPVDDDDDDYVTGFATGSFSSGSFSDFDD